MYIHVMKCIYCSLLLLVIVACSGGNTPDNHKTDNISRETSILNLSFAYSEGERIISFPVLFNDSIVKEKGIKSIERVFYYASSDSTEQITPEKKITYLFDENGLVKEMIVGNFYDNRIISTIQINYKEHQSETGYAKATRKEVIQTEDFPYHEFKQLKNTKNLISFENLVTKNQLFLVPNKKHWKPLVIDTLCHPDRNDIVVWGSLKYPEKIYQVQNLVEENNVRDFTYNYGVLHHIEWTDDPFKIHRTFRFNKSGSCVGFVDSTFSMGGFVATAEFNFKLKNNLPVSVTKELLSGTGRRTIFMETFEYILAE
jgi:hypothetical protein